MCKEGIVDDLLKNIAERLQQLRASREQHQQQLTAYQQAVQQLTAQIYAESGAIAELEELLKLVEEEKE